MRPLDIDVLKKIIEESSETTEIMIGCDSQRGSKKKSKGKRVRTVTYARVVVLHIDGNKGCMVFGDLVKEDDYGGLKQRLMKEVGFATGLAYELLDVIGDRKFSIHLDINQDPKHKSNIAMKEAVGWVRGMFGVDPVLKPHSVVAMTCADHFVRI
jgi:predicted RNase H-related nuclease YkuK (DUF458 family)